MLIARVEAMSFTGPKMDEATSRFWTTIFAGITAFGLIGGGFYTLWQYLDGRKKDIQNQTNYNATYTFQVEVARMGARAPFNAKRLDLCSDASAAAATIGTTKDPKLKQKAIEDFWRLYWGPLGIVEGGDVAGAMVEFGKCLNRSCDDLRGLALAVAHSCRKEVSAGFELGLPTVPNRPTESDE